MCASGLVSLTTEVANAIARCAGKDWVAYGGVCYLLFSCIMDTLHY
jgi:hypothetical protein